MNDLLAALRSAVGAEHVLHGPIGQFIFSKDAGLQRSAPAVAVLPASTAEVQSIMKIAKKFDRVVVPRGAGSGLTGGSVGGPEAIVVVMTRMNTIWEIDEQNRTALVDPGVINLDLSLATKNAGLHFAPDPSSQSVCTIGGNVGNNAGGPHCLAEGSTVNHILALEIVTAEGEVITVGGKGPQPVGLDLRGVLVGSEGTLGIATKILVKLIQNPPATATFLIAFSEVEHAAATVTDIIANGVVPAALELMDQTTVRVVENFIHAGMNTDAAALLLVEVMGHQAGVDSEARMITSISRDNGAFEVRIAKDDAERDQFWKGRKAAFGAVAQLSPDFYLHDTVVPRHRLVEVMTAIYEIGERYNLIMMNVFHAGDGNLHPILGFDLRQDGVREKVEAASREILEVCVAAGGALSGEHGIGLEKRDYMPLIFSPTDLDAQARLQEAFDPQERLNPDKVLPKGARCAEFGQPIPKGAWV